MVLNILHAPFLVKFGMVFCVLLGLPLGATGTLPLAQDSISTLRSNTLLESFGLIGESRAFWCRFKNDRDLTSCLVLQKSGVVSDRKIVNGLV